MSGTLQNPARSISDRRPDERPDQAPRIAIVTRRLWPLAGEAEASVLQLADELQQAGAKPTLITPQWQKHWAENTSLRSIPLVRLPWPATPGWGLLRYLYSLSRFLRQQRSEFDAVIVQGLRAEAYCALASLEGNGPPVILRASEAGTYGEVAWQRQARFGSRIAAKCRQAAAVIASSPFVADELRAANYPAAHIHVLQPNVSLEMTPRGEDARESARHALAGVNHDLHVVGGAPVVVCISPLQGERGLEAMIRSWLPIQLRWPHARLWIMGDGPERESLFRLICDLDLRYRVVIPGAFDHWDDLLQAADVYLAPAPQPSTSLVLRAALTSGIAVVASDQAQHRGLLSPERNGLLYNAADRNSLTQCLTRLFANPAFGQQLGEFAQQQSSSEASLAAASESQWLQNFVAAERSV